MNKKIILGLVIGGALYYQFGRKKDEAETTESQEGSPIVSNSDIFSKYENRVLADSNGYWMLIKNGKIFSPTDQNSLNTYAKANPSLPFLTVNEDIWKYYAENFPQVFGGAF